MREISYNAKAEFAKYLKRVELSNLDPQSVQYIELRRAFFGGLSAAFVMVQEMADTDVSDKEGERILVSLQVQLETFWNEECQRLSG